MNFKKTLLAAMPKMIGNPLSVATAMVSFALSVVKGQKAKKATKGKKKTTVRKSRILSKKQKQQMEVMERICQSVYGTYIRGVTTVAARYIGHPAVAIPASEMVKTMMEEAAPTVNYLVQLKAEPKKESNIKEEKKPRIDKHISGRFEYLKGCTNGWYTGFTKAIKGEQVIDEKYTLENLFSGNLTIEDIPDYPEYMTMVGATIGAKYRGLWNSAKGTYDTVKTLVTEPGKVWDAVSSEASDFIEHPIQHTKKFVSETCDNVVDAVWRSTPQDMAEDVGEIVGDVAVDALTAGSGAAITTGLKAGAKKLTVRAGKTVTKTVAKTAGKTAIKEAGKKTIKELIPDAKTVKKWVKKELPTDKGWLKNVVTAGGDINVLKKNHYQAILPNDEKSVKDILQKMTQNTAKETVGEFAENKAVNLTKDKIVKETKKEVVEEVKDKTVGETKHKTEATIKEVVREDSKRAGDSVHTSPAVDETKINKVETTKNVTSDIKKQIVNSNFKNLMSFKESIRYNKYWLDVAEKISNEALEKHIIFINHGGIRKPSGKSFKPVKVSVALDLNTGNMYFGYNGSNPKVFNPSRTEIVPELQKRINRTKKLAANKVNNPYASRMSFKKWSVDNCAEVYAVNNLLRDGGEFNNIFINTKYSLEKQKSKYLLTAPPCKNCEETFKECFFPKKIMERKE